MPPFLIFFHFQGNANKSIILMKLHLLFQPIKVSLFKLRVFVVAKKLMKKACWTEPKVTFKRCLLYNETAEIQFPTLLGFTQNKC